MNLQETSHSPHAVQANVISASVWSTLIRPLTKERAMMFLPDPEYPWKWNWRLDGQPSEYLGFSTVGSGTILHKEHLKHFCISASSSFRRDKAISPLSIFHILRTDRRLTSPEN
jgi:hypothetical protein